MKKQDYEALANALKIAKAKALEMRTIEDTGTCNFDSPLLLLGGTSETTLEKLFGSEYGVYKRGIGAYVIGYKILEGQGWRRTKMAETFANALREQGYKAYTYYAMD